jgi:hypothetical protein
MPIFCTGVKRKVYYQTRGDLLILNTHTSTMTEWLGEIVGEPKVIRALTERIDGPYFSLPEIERMRLQIIELEHGKEAMANELARIRGELLMAKAAKLAILSSWKYSMMQVCPRTTDECVS